MRFSAPLLLVTLAALPLQAQVTAGATAGAVRLGSGATQSAATGILQLQPSDWLTLLASPAFVHLSQTLSGTTYTSSGMGDLPLGAAADRTLDGPLPLDLGAALTLSLPTGNSACGLGTGTTGLGGDVGVGAAVAPKLRLALDASRALSGSDGTSALSPSEATSLSADAELQLTPKWTGSVSLSGDFGPADSAQALERAVGFGGRYTIAGDLAFVVDTRFGLNSGSTPWAFSIGLGTAFGGTNPVSGDYSSKRIAKALAGGSQRGQGKGKFGKTVTCH